jgi:Rieske Fe-S protein
MNAPISRRAALAGGLGGAGLLTLAACSSGVGSDPNPPASSGPATSDRGASTASRLAALDSIAVGEAVSANLDGKPVLVARPTQTTAVCFSAICTHQGCTVAPAGKELHCPCHDSVYNATTGAVISGPAPRALDEVPVTVKGVEVVAAG